ncbi:MAG TPA: hypothetical protein VLQ48_02660, partial [Chloroflexia bacterium]|nr:hypothetical protein [Chloroflexia bacterium]
MRVLSILLLLVTTLLASFPLSVNARYSPTAPLSSLAQPFTGDPIAPRPAPLTPAPYTTYFTETGHYLGGEFLDYYNASPQAATLYGLPISEEFPQQFNDGTILYVQYFERARMEWHPELPDGQRVQLGALSPAILGNTTFDQHVPVDNTESTIYFPETGHTLSNAFLTYWRDNGGLGQFGYPISEETSDNGVTVQWFERARFEFYGDMPEPYGVQLSPVGYLALKAGNFNLPMGTFVRFNPPSVAEGHTTTITVGASAGVSVTGEYEGNVLTFQLDPERGVAWAVLGA